MSKWEVNGIDVTDWRNNSLELAKLQGLPDDAILCLPSKIGKTQMLRIAYDLAAARNGIDPPSDKEILDKLKLKQQ